MTPGPVTVPWFETGGPAKAAALPADEKAAWDVYAAWTSSGDLAQPLVDADAPDVVFSSLSSPIVSGLGPVLVTGTTHGGHLPLRTTWLLRTDDGLRLLDPATGATNLDEDGVSRRYTDLSVCRPTTSAGTRECASHGEDLRSRLLATAPDQRDAAVRELVGVVTLLFEGVPSTSFLDGVADVPKDLKWTLPERRPIVPVQSTWTADGVDAHGWLLTGPASLGGERLIRFSLHADAKGWQVDETTLGFVPSFIE